MGVSARTSSTANFKVTYKTAWFMAHRLREAMKRPAIGGVA
jgi:hypothetical protein